jgi:cytosine deaminase
MGYALRSAQRGGAEGGVPIGAALVIGGEVVATGNNRRVQDGSVIRHAEMDCLENAGRLDASDYRRAALYTSLAPCRMCTGALLLYGIPEVVIGENDHFTENEDLMVAQGVNVTVLNDERCWELMERFVRANAELWSEDIGGRPGGQMAKVRGPRPDGRWAGQR